MKQMKMKYFLKKKNYQIIKLKVINGKFLNLKINLKINLNNLIIFQRFLIKIKIYKTIMYKKIITC